MKDDRVYLDHILEAVARIRVNAQEGKDAFLASHMLQDATLRNLQTMTEATQRLSPERKAARPEIPWRELVAFRNILVHQYLGIDLELVWQVIERDLPALDSAARAMRETIG